MTGGTVLIKEINSFHSHVKHMYSTCTAHVQVVSSTWFTVAAKTTVHVLYPILHTHTLPLSLSLFLSSQYKQRSVPPSLFITDHTISYQDTPPSVHSLKHNNNIITSTENNSNTNNGGASVH